MRMILQIIISNGILDLVTGILAKISLGTGIWYPPSQPSGKESVKAVHSVNNLYLPVCESAVCVCHTPVSPRSSPFAG